MRIKRGEKKRKKEIHKKKEIKFNSENALKGFLNTVLLCSYSSPQDFHKKMEAAALIAGWEPYGKGKFLLKINIF